VFSSQHTQCKEDVTKSPGIRYVVYVTGHTSSAREPSRLAEDREELSHNFVGLLISSDQTDHSLAVAINIGTESLHCRLAVLVRTPWR